MRSAFSVSLARASSKACSSAGEHREHLAVEADGLRKEFVVQLASLVGEVHLRPAAVFRNRQALDQLARGELGDVARGACPLEVRAIGQFGRRHRAVRRQQCDQPPFAPRDAVPALAQADHHRAARGEQAAQPVVEQVVDGAGVGQGHGSGEGTPG
jgi:hypothetical protein